MEPSNRNKIIIASGIVVLALAVFLWGLKSEKEINETDQKSPTWDATPRKNIEVPEKDTEKIPENVARPIVAEPNISDSESKIRLFEITAENNAFTPDTVVINANDTILIKITAVDRDYDFVQPDYKLKQTIPKGETKKVGFQGSATGEFTFFCEICGGPEKGAKGFVIIKPKE